MQRLVETVLAAWASAEPDRLQRLKACVNPDCGWVFYDTSRSRSGTWCLMNVCGARHKMERYRSRQR
jgi:predicted RNA-binding Zn ribbon-like protein